jgi:histidinol-phosphatase
MYEQELAFANELADRADEISMSLFRGDFEVMRKPDQTPVTEADLRIEETIRKELAARFPGDAVLGEEGGLEAGGESDRVWVIDPIDGTKNFAAQIQIWGTLIALMVGDEPVMGVASAPALGERYTAANGIGATLNGEPISVSDRDDLPEALISFGGLKEWQDGPQAGALTELVRRSGRTRGFGDFWGHMLVARGSADVMVEESLRTWDWAAIAPIVREAGGRITQLEGSPLADRAGVLTTNGVLHDALVDLFKN